MTTLGCGACRGRRGLALDVTGGLEDAWSRAATFVTGLAAFLVVLLVGWLVARTIARVLDRALRGAGSERLAERSGVGRLLRDAPRDMTGIVCGLVFGALMLVVLHLALGVFGAGPARTALDGVIAWLPRGIVAVVLVVVALAVAGWVRDVVGAVLSSASYGGTVASGLWALIAGLGAVAALGQAGIAEGVVLPVFYAGLGTVAGIAVVGVGGGLIGPMRARWERWLTRAEQEVSVTRVRVRAYRAAREEPPPAGPSGPTRRGEGGPHHRGR